MPHLERFASADPSVVHSGLAHLKQRLQSSEIIIKSALRISAEQLGQPVTDNPSRRTIGKVDVETGAIVWSWFEADRSLAPDQRPGTLLHASS
jgi:hypothetical protein